MAVGFLTALQLPPPIKAGSHEIAQKQCLKMALKHQKTKILIKIKHKEEMSI